ncbi:hypothetical protein PP707_06755 [Acetobacter pasteurianus]|nr:hypothetical protein [Acetobacter pasteurianus]
MHLQSHLPHIAFYSLDLEVAPTTRTSTSTTTTVIITFVTKST